LLEAGCDIDIFPFYPLDPSMWRYVPDILGEDSFARSRVHHVGFLKSVLSLRPSPLVDSGTFLRDTFAISASATRFGIAPVVKTLYVSPKAWAWSRSYGHQYDHVLAYWGNYSASCAYMFHRLMKRSVPFSMFLHAGMDLYEDPVYLRQKLLYADNIIVVCDFNRQFIQDRYADIYPSISGKIYKYHLGLDLSALKFKPNARTAKKVLAVGAFEKYKGFEYLLMAAAELTRRGIDYELELVGDGKETNALKALADKLAISQMVRFPGWLKPAEVHAAMEAASIFVHPSNGIGDAVPTVIKESMALGAPVIASNMAGIPELLDHGRCGVLVPPGNSQALAAAIADLLANDDLRRNYANAARRYAEREFDLWRNGERLARLLTSSRRDSSQKHDALKIERSPSITG